MKTRKKTNLLRTFICVTMCVLMLLSMSACREQDANDEYAEIFANATYKEDTSIGEGETSFPFEVTVGTHTVKFEVRTDKETVGEALLDCGLISGDEGDFGLYVKTVNGILADYDIDASYWAFYENGEYAMSGVDLTTITSGVTYAFVYSK